MSARRTRIRTPRKSLTFRRGESCRRRSVRRPVLPCRRRVRCRHSRWRRHRAARPFRKARRLRPTTATAPLPGLPPGQRQPRGAPGGSAAVQPGDEVVTAPPAQKIVNKQAVFSGLDKITGRIIKFDVDMGETVQFGALRVKPQACYTRPATEAANTDSFVEVDEITLQGEVKRIFSGWMFAASPGLSGVEHPIYDVWLTDCKGPEATVASAEPAPPPRAAPPQQKKQPAKRQAPPPPPPQQFQPLPGFR